MLGQRVYVSFASMAGVIVGIEYPYPDDPHSALYEVELEDSRICYATMRQLS
jgi:hypothetical protein